MNWADVLVAFIAYLGGLTSAIIAVRAARPKTQAEARHAEAEATTHLLNGYTKLLTALESTILQLRTDLAHEQRRASILPILTKNIEALEFALKAANQHIAISPWDDSRRESPGVNETRGGGHETKQ